MSSETRALGSKPSGRNPQNLSGQMADTLTGLSDRSRDIETGITKPNWHQVGINENAKKFFSRQSSCGIVCRCAPRFLTRTVRMISMTSKFLLWLVATSLGSLAASDATAQTYKTLHSFTSVDPYTNTNSEGANPFSSVTVSEDALFGTTQYGGNSRSGSLFKMNVDGTGFTNLHNFNPNTDGNFPYRRLILSGNTLYGTTGQGGGSGNGTLFKINTDGTGFTNFHNFSALLSSTNTDGARPYGPLVLSGDTLYGTAFAGGLSGHGTVFKLQTDGSGFVTMHSFTGDG